MMNMCVLLVEYPYDVFRPLVEEPASLPSESSDEDSEDGSNSQRQQMSEERRAKLREIEVLELASVCI